MDAKPAAREQFENLIQSLEGEFVAFGINLRHDSRLRQLYTEQLRAMATSMVKKIEAGALTWEQAAAQAVETRNILLEMGRGKSSALGRAFAQDLKLNPRTFNQIVGEVVANVHGPNSSFQLLSRAQQDRVFAEVVSKAGRSRGSVDVWMRRAGKVAKPLVVFSVAHSLYEVATAEDWTRELAQQGSSMAAGSAGYYVGMVVGGLVCGPAAPLCVGVGAFVGGAVAGYLADEAWGE